MPSYPSNHLRVRSRRFYERWGLPIGLIVIAILVILLTVPSPNAKPEAAQQKTLNNSSPIGELPASWYLLIRTSDALGSIPMKTEEVCRAQEQRLDEAEYRITETFCLSTGF